MKPYLFRSRLAILAALVFLTWSIGPTPGYCWDKYTHMVIAQIAHDRLNPTAKAKVDALAALMNQDPLSLELTAEDKPYNFVSIAAWPDDIRSLGAETRSFGAWHYIDLDPSLPSNDSAAVAAVKAYKAPNGESNVYDAIVNKCLPTLQDPGAKPADQARMLAFLTHFVGDIHMPLHCYGPLRGGNDYAITPIPGSEPGYAIKNLHAYWDGAMRYDSEDGGLLVNTTPDAPRPVDVKSLADAIEAGYLTKNKKLLRQRNPAMWAVESSRVAAAAVFPSDKTATLSLAYIHASRRIALERIALAGYRLANILNALYPNAGK